MADGQARPAEETYEICQLQKRTLRLADTEDLLKVGIENVKELHQVYQWQSLYRDVEWPYTVGKTPCAKR